MKKNLVKHSDLLEIIERIDDRIETVHQMFSPEEIYPKINVTLHKAFPSSNGKKLIHGIEKTTTFRKMASGKGNIWNSFVEVISYNQFVNMLFRMNIEVMEKAGAGQGGLYHVYNMGCMTESIKELHRLSNRRITNGVVAPTSQCMLSRIKGPINDHVDVRIDVATLTNKCGSNTKNDDTNQRFYSRTDTSQLVACSTRRLLSNLKATTRKQSFKPCKDVMMLHPHLSSVDTYKSLCENIVQCQINVPVTTLFMNNTMAAGSPSHKGGNDDDNIIKEHINPSLSSVIKVIN